MITIKFTATPSREKPKWKWSTEDTNLYGVRYIPPRGCIEGSCGGDFSNLLLEAICGLPEHNSAKMPVRIEMDGEFPIKYSRETERLAGFYSRAENVDVEIKEEMR